MLTQSDFMEAMGMYYSGWIAKNAPEDASLVPAEIPHFLAQKSLIPFINNRLGHLQNIVLKYLGLHSYSKETVIQQVTEFGRMTLDGRVCSRCNYLHPQDRYTGGGIAAHLRHQWLEVPSSRSYIHPGFYERKGAEQ